MYYPENYTFDAGMFPVLLGLLWITFGHRRRKRAVLASHFRESDLWEVVAENILRRGKRTPRPFQGAEQVRCRSLRGQVFVWRLEKSICS